MPRAALIRAASPSNPAPTARLATGLTTVAMGRVIIGRPAW
jgi:hypothetical protein